MKILSYFLLTSLLLPLTGQEKAPEIKSSGTLRANEIDWEKMDNPATDGWTTEQFNQLAGDQLKKLGKLLVSGKSITPQDLTSLATPSFKGSPVFPASLKTVLSDPPLVVTRGTPSSTPAEGLESFATLLNDLTTPLAGLTEGRAKFKIFRIRANSPRFQTKAYFELFADLQDRRIEQHATWTVEWIWEKQDAKPKITGISSSPFEQSTLDRPSWFVDCTHSLLKDVWCYETQLLRGYGHWLARVPHGIYLESMGSPGIALGDVNGDGLDDFYLCQERGLPNRLFLQKKDGTVEEASKQWGVDWLESSRSALLVDLDNDGDQDLAVAVMGGIVLARNEDQKSFRFVALLPTTEDLMSLAAADYDNDGDLDLYACGYYADKQLDSQGDSGGSVLPTADLGFVMHDANTGGKSHLFRNDHSVDSGEWTFTDVTVESGLDVNNRRFSFGASWEDFDNDGDQDLYIANDFGRDNLYRNDGGTFTDISDTAHIEDSGTGMGIAWGDFNRDGFMDAYVSNMFSSAGGRITFQDQFKPSADPKIKNRIQELARGNTVLQNTGKGSFLDISGPSGAEMGRWSWGSLFTDLNNDGWEDLVAANGYITAEDTGDL